VHPLSVVVFMEINMRHYFWSALHIYISILHTLKIWLEREKIKHENKNVDKDQVKERARKFNFSK
jgi:hypothetical protein